MDRAYSWLDIKSIDRAQRIIEGVASTPEPDRGRDALDPFGAEFTLPMPFLLEHGDPIGQVFAADVKADGIHIKAQIARVEASAPPEVRTRLTTAWAEMTSTPPMRRGLSVGWRPLESKVVNGVRRVSRWILGEISAVVVPMNAHALITSVKALAEFDHASVALQGTRSGAVASIAGVPGFRLDTSMNVSEQLTAEKATLQVKSARLEELMTDEQTNGGLEEDASRERDTLIGEVKSLTASVGRLQVQEAARAALASAITLPVPGQRTKTRVEFKTVDLPKGSVFTRVAMALAAGRGSIADSIEYAKQFTNTPEVVAYIKGGWHRKAVPGSAVAESPGWGSELVNPNTAQTEFVELLRAETIIGKVEGFRRAEFNIPIITQTGGSTFEWVGAHQPKPVGELAFERTTLGFSKVAGIVVMDEELVRLSSPNAEAIVRNDMIEQCARFIDQQFIRVGVSATDVSPASITNSVSSPTATGTTAASLRHDLNIALKVFTDAGVSTRGLVIVMTSALARGISLLTTTLGVPEFPSMTPEGGTLIGYQVIVSDSVDSGTVVVFQPREILLADDGRMTLDASREATLDMSNGSSASFSLWQNNCVGLRGERWIRWQKRRADGVVAVIDTAAYAPA